MRAQSGSHSTQAREQPTLADKVAIGATLALYDELALAPKPGLVSFADSGSHRDMDARTFMRSLNALRGYFCEIAHLGRDRAAFPLLELCGQRAEQAMLAATGGINTHRGAIFSLGLICASAAANGGVRDPSGVDRVRAALADCWGDALRQRAGRHSELPGGIAAARYGLRGASAEAALGFPTLFEVAYPALTAALAQGLSWKLARLQALFAAMSVLEDCNVAHRAGLDGLAFVRSSARQFLEAGGAGRDGAITAAWAMHQEFIGRGLSPGGAADTLAAACCLHRLTLSSG
jgi:triphosphoribosyl-dephospho-CoA synthase